MRNSVYQLKLYVPPFQTQCSRMYQLKHNKTNNMRVCQVETQIFSHTRWGFPCFYSCEIILSHITVPVRGKEKNPNSRASATCRSMTSLLCYNVTMTYLSVLRIFCFFMFFQYKMRYLVVSKKRIHYSCEDGIEKSVPRYHCLSSLGKPRYAKR